MKYNLILPTPVTIPGNLSFIMFVGKNTLFCQSNQTIQLIFVWLFSKPFNTSVYD